MRLKINRYIRQKYQYSNICVFAASRTGGLLVLVWKNIFALHFKLIFHLFYIHVCLYLDHLSTATPSLWKCSSLPRFGGKLTVGSCAWTCNVFKTLYFPALGLPANFQSIWKCFGIYLFSNKKSTQFFSHTLKMQISECWNLPCSLRSPSSPQIPIQTWEVTVIIMCNDSFSIDVFVDNFTFVMDQKKQHINFKIDHR